MYLDAEDWGDVATIRGVQHLGLRGLGVEMVGGRSVVGDMRSQLVV